MSDDQSDEDGMDVEEHHSVYSHEFPGLLLDDDRERGLSKTDRRFLVTGETSSGEPSESVRSNTHTRIRRRIRETILDFWLISVYLDEHDRELIFDERSPMEDWEMREGIKSAMEFFYRGLDDSGLMDFETALVSAVHDAEQARHDGPVRVETDFEVDVNEHFDTEDAYERFQQGRPLEPMEVGALLATGRVTDPAEIVRLGKHANRSGLIPSSISPLLAKQLSETVGGPETQEIFTTLAHEPSLHRSGPDAGVPDPLRGEDIFKWEPPDEDSRPATREDLPDRDIEAGAESSDEAGVPPEVYEDALRQLSTDLDEPITVGDEVVYEDGDRHVVERDDDDDDTPADADR